VRGKRYDNVAGEYAWKHGQSTKEIAADLGMSESAVESCLYRALSKIKRLVESGEANELVDFSK